MILTCPACATKYVVKDNAVPAGGRQVRCASCKHSWHQDPDPTAQPASAEAQAPVVDEQSSGQAEEFQGAAVVPEEAIDAPPPPTVPEPVDEAATSAPADDGQWTRVEPAVSWDEPGGSGGPAVAEDFEPFYDHEPIEQPRRKWPLLLLLALVVALGAVAFWFLAPADLRARVGLGPTGASQLDVVVVNQNIQKLASGNNLLTVSGRVVNSTDDRQPVPPLRAQLLDATKRHVVYSWTISLPTASLEPNKSASFNSAEVDVPEDGKHLRLRLGGPA